MDTFPIRVPVVRAFSRDQRISADRYTCYDNCSPAVRSDFQGAAQLPEPLAHSPDPDSRRAHRVHGSPLLVRYALAFVLHFQADLAVATANANLGDRAFRMTVDGRSIFSMQEEGTVGNATCNFWTVRIDQRTGKPIEKPQQLTHWTGFCMSPLSTTKDGKRLAFLEWTGNATLYVAELKTGETRMGPERHLTLSESNDFLGDWTRDSKSIVFWSNRDGHNGIYKQLIDEDSPQLLVSSEEQLGWLCESRR